MGSPETEKSHHADEAPLHRVKMGAFGMGKNEITWDEYDLFVYPDKGVDGLTGPTAPFVDMSFGMGKAGYPAVNMTQYAALSYCRWLTARTGSIICLPLSHY